MHLPAKIIFYFRTSLGAIVNTILGKLGLRLIRLSVSPQYDDVGRTYNDPPNVFPNFVLRPGVPKPYAEAPTIFTINNGSSIIEEEVLYSHLTLLKMLKDFNFETILDLGSHEKKVTRIFCHLGKKVTTIEIADGHKADYNDDYMKVSFPEKFDAIWCSAVLEHQRNVGEFLDKIFDDLRDDGVLALTNPFDLGTNLTFGHCNCFSPLVLLYHLVLAGFDCSKISLRCYNYSIGIIIKKKYNGIPRHQSFAMEPSTPDKFDLAKVRDKEILVSDIMKNLIFNNMSEAFPFEITSPIVSWNNKPINWGDPI